MGRTFRPKTKANPRGAGRRRLPDSFKRQSINITLHPEDFPMFDALCAKYSQDIKQKVTRSRFISAMIQGMYESPVLYDTILPREDEE